MKKLFIYISIVAFFVLSYNVFANKNNTEEKISIKKENMYVAYENGYLNILTGEFVYYDAKNSQFTSPVEVLNFGEYTKPFYSTFEHGYVNSETGCFTRYDSEKSSFKSPQSVWAYNEMY